MSTVAQINAQINLKDNLSKPLGDANDKVKKFADKAGNELSGFSKKANEAWKTFGTELQGLGQKMQMTGAAMTLGITTPIVGLGKQAIDAAAKMQSMRASMTAITGSAQMAETQLKDLESMAGRTATGYDLLTQASMGLVAGFDGDVKGANYVLERFATLSNVLNVSRTDFERVTTNLIQIGGTSRLAGDELREMSNILPNFRSLLKEAFGTNQTEQLAKFGISGRQALEGIARAIDAQGFKANTQTYNAQLQVLSTEFFKLKVVAGEVLLPMATMVVQSLIPAFQSLAENIRNLTPEQKKLALGLIAATAAAGPLIAAFGTIANGVGALMKGGGAIGKLVVAFKDFGGVAAIAQRAAVLIRSAMTVLTGPVGAVIAVVTALYLAWKNNLFNIQGIIIPFVKKVVDMFSELYANIENTVQEIGPVIAAAWQQVVTTLKPILQVINTVVQTYLINMVRTAEDVFRYFTDMINSFLGGLRMIFGAGFNDLTDTMKASLLRMRSTAIVVMASIAQVIINAFKAMTGWASKIPGIGGLYDSLLEGAQDRVDAMLAEGKAATWLADQYMQMAKTTQKAVGDTGEFNFAPGATKTGGGGAGAGAMAAKGTGKKVESEEERLRKQIIEETLALRRELTAEIMKSQGATLKDILAVQEYGKKYQELQTGYRRAKIDAMAALEQFKTGEEIKKAAAEAETERLQRLSQQRMELNQSVLNAAAGYQQEREQINFTTQEERARWEVTRGGYKEASAFARAFYVLQARLLDQARRTKEAAEKWKEFWTKIKQSHDAWVKSQNEQAQDKYDEYVKRLTTEMLQLQGATEEIMRADLAEQFKGMVAGMVGSADALKRVVEAAKFGTILTDPKEKAAADKLKAWIDDIAERVKKLGDMKDVLRLIQMVATGINNIFNNALNDLFENGFKSFFTSVLGGFRDLARQIAAEVLKIQLIKALIWGVGQIGGAGAGADLSKILLPGRAVGGQTFGGQPYVVGERGPEVFIPNVSGRVQARSEIGSLGNGTGAGQNITVNLQVPNYQAFRRSEAQAAGLVFARAARARAREGR